MNEHSKRKAELAHLLDEAANVRTMLEARVGRKLTDAEVLALAMGDGPSGDELEDGGGDDDDDEDGLDYDELDDTCPRSSSA
jgi:hypothetical protein